MQGHQKYCNKIGGIRGFAADVEEAWITFYHGVLVRERLYRWIERMSGIPRVSSPTNHAGNVVKYSLSLPSSANFRYCRDLFTRPSDKIENGEDGGLPNFSFLHLSKSRPPFFYLVPKLARERNLLLEEGGRSWIRIFRVQLRCSHDSGCTNDRQAFGKLLKEWFQKRGINVHRFREYTKFLFLSFFFHEFVEAFFFFL